MNLFRRILTRPARAARSLFVLLSVTAVATTASAQDFKLQAQLDPQQVEVGESSVYSLTISYDSQTPPAPNPPQFDQAFGFNAPRFEGTSTQTQMVNGVVSRSVEYRYSFQATKEGKFTIPPTGFTFGGKSYMSNPVTLNVAKGAVTAAAQVPQDLQGKIVPPQVAGDAALRNALTGVVFVYAVLENGTPYNGEQVIVTYYLAIDQPGLDKAGLHGSGLVAPEISVPEMKQFIKEEMFPVPKQFQWRESQIGSKSYTVAPLYQVAVTPTKSGKLSIEPFQITLLFGSKRARRAGGTRDAFFGGDPFGDDPFLNSMNPLMGGNRVRVIAMSPQLDLDVKQLPSQGKPADFSGAVGEFNATATVDKQQVVASEDILKLDLKIEGKGDASGLATPKLPNIDGLTLLEDPKSNAQHRTENDQFYSSKTFSYLLRPTKPGKLAIPPITYSVFSPRAGEYMHIQSDPLSVEVKPSTQKQVALVAPSTPGSVPSDKPAANEGPKEINQDINYIHTSALEAVQPGALSGEGPGFIALLCFPPAILAAGYIVGRRRILRENNRAYYREVVAADAARKRLRKANKLANGGDSAAFYAELAGAMRSYFADKFHLDAAGLTVDQIEDALREREIDEGLVIRVRSLLEECDMARYAPVQRDSGVMQRTCDNAAQLLQEVEKTR